MMHGTMKIKDIYIYIYIYRTANLQVLHFIYYSTDIRTEYFKYAAHTSFFFSSKCRLFHNATFFGSCVIHILYTKCAKIKKKNSDAKGLSQVTMKNCIWRDLTLVLPV